MPPIRLHPSSRAIGPRAAFAFLLGLAAGAAAARCTDADPGTAATELAVAPADVAVARRGLRDLVARAVQRSQAVGAARLLAEAAASDVEETRATARPQAALSGDVGGARSEVPGLAPSQGGQAQATVNVGAPLYDGGRLDALTGWRRQLAEAARLGEIGAEEQVALQTVSLSLDRARYGLRTQVYGQYVAKMGCLVEALEQIVAADHGRQSELVQAQKNRQQAELSESQSRAGMRLVETRLRRFVGDALPAPEGLAAVLVDLPPLDRVLAEAAGASSIAQLAAQADALDNYTRSVEAGRKPQVNWAVAAAQTVGSGRSNTLSAGITYTVPLYDPVIGHSIDAAQRRARAARLQREDALDATRAQMAEAHEQASAAFDRARRTVDILANSERLRNATLLQWQQLGRRSLFDVMATEGEHYQLRAAHVDAVFDAELAHALLRSLGRGVGAALD